ncbi:MAG: hypothetical protein L0Z62_33810 [Gemmataceae bacterium]|nr:hypothetical protein [Gemmataceae bacterium]
MSEPLTIPTPDEIDAQILAREQEIKALRKLRSLSRAAALARSARSRQVPLESLGLAEHEQQGGDHAA